MKAKPHTVSSLLAALALAGGLSAVQAQTAAPDAPSMQTPSTEPAPPSGTQPPPAGMPDTPPGGAAGQGGIEIDPDEARAIMQAREMCSKAAGPQAQQDCMNQAQQDYIRSRSGGSPGSMPQDSSGSGMGSGGSMQDGSSPRGAGSSGAPLGR